jgi:carboxyl-terminal processing protease
MSKALRIILSLVVILFLATCAFTGGVAVGWSIPRNMARNLPIPIPVPQETTSQDTGTPTEVSELFQPFWYAWQLVHQNYVDQPVNDTALMQGAIRGMMQALGDPHSSYMDPDQYQQANTPLEGEYEGIGAWVDISGEYLKIISPMPNSPAEKANLKAEDQIIAVDGEDVTGMDGNLVLRRVLGPAGTKVTLTIWREATNETFDVTITRAKITIPSVESKMLEGNIAYIQIFTFGENTDKDLRKQLQELLDQKPAGIILDLRNNGGGYLYTAVAVVSQFISSGPVLYEVYGDGKRDTYNALGNGLATDIPLVVLVNEGTASASEITAGAIQDYQRGTLVGTTTFGKGSVQIWQPLTENQGAVRITVARWLTPKERQINGIGLTPDIEVPITEEDIAAQRDPQLDKAIELLRKP